MAVREAVGKQAAPTVAIVDSQSVKTTEAGSPRGYGAGKKIKGRKHHIAVDTLSLPIKCQVTTADKQDLDALPAHVSTRMREILTRNVTRHSHGPYGILANRVAALASIRPPHPLTTRKVPTPSSTTLSTTLRAP